MLNKNALLRQRILWLLLLLLAASSTCLAHPMGNFSVNHYTKITIGTQFIDCEYLIDRAEIPTFQEMRQYGISQSEADPATRAYLEGQERLLKAGLSLEIDGRPLTFDAITRQITFAPGAGGLPTMKLRLRLRAEFAELAGTHRLSYADNNFPGRAGWKEIVILSNGVAINGNSASGADRSQELTNYSSDALNSPPQQVSALVTYAATSTARIEHSAAGDAPQPATSNSSSAVRAPLPSVRADSSKKKPASTLASGVAPSGVASPAPPASSTSQAQNTPRSPFTDLISTQSKLSLWILLSAGLIAAGLGALHALEPGHGKTIVAAYLIGSRGTARHAVLLGVVVTAAHTAGVYVLGAITLYASRYIVPDRLYPWLGAISGLTVTGLGVFIFLRHLTGETADHSHGDGDNHSHWIVSLLKTTDAGTGASSLPAREEEEKTSRRLSLRELCMLGITGGIVPCPAALVVLLSSFSLHRIGFGLFLITGFSCGLALVLVGIGISMVYAKRLVSTRLRPGGFAIRYLPFVSSAFMAVLGLGITVSAFGSVHVLSSLPSKDRLLPFITVVILGLFLGMRHSTDADHVVAISTIVSRRGTVKSSAVIGLLWGLGHTITIFLVGSAIIVFGVVIPPRLGLSMEFSVAVMLVFLGLMNLTGIMRWIKEHFTPANRESVSLGVLPAHASVAGGVQATISRVGGAIGALTRNLGVYQAIRPVAVGLVHGLAGSAAVALLVLSTIKSPLWATAYLLVFGVGTMVGMMLMTSVISVPFIFTGKAFTNVNRHMVSLSGLVSMAFGAFLVYRIGFVDGLFSAHVSWIPQ